MRRRTVIGRFGLFSTTSSGTVLFGVERLETRVMPAVDLRFAVIGDYGSAAQGGVFPAREASVANLVSSWNPAFVATLGDNNYPGGSAATIDANVGQYYHQYMSPYNGTYGKGSADGVNHFFPAMGNHEWDTTNAQPYLNYFNPPNNGRYYDVTVGNVELFFLDSNPQEPDGTSSTSIQANWLQSQLAASTATWKLVIDHHPVYTSADVGSTTYMQWPFQAWGATAVLSGHAHVYERLIENGLPYFVDGLGGEDIQGFGTPIAGARSVMRVTSGRC